MFRVEVPEKLNHVNVASFYRKTIDFIKFYGPSEICFDFNKLTFIDPSGVVTLSNMVDLIFFNFENKVKMYIDIPDDFKRYPKSYLAIDYLDDSLFFKKLLGETIHPLSKKRTTTNGLEVLKRGTYNQGYIDRTVAWLRGSVSLKNKSFSYLETALGEAFNNIIDHSGSEIGGCAFAQHYPNKNFIQLGIGDCGMGIPNKIRTIYSTDDKGRTLDSDCQAIEFATKEKITTKSTPGNRGAGLNNMVEIIKNNKGSIKILSNHGLFEYNYKYDHSWYPNKTKLHDSNEFYHGTLVVLTLRTDTLENEEEEDLLW